jgi:plastocyanin
MKKLTITLALGALAPFALTACGGGGSSSSSSSTTAATTSTTGAGGSTSGGGETVDVAADPSGAFKFDPSSLSAKAGNDTFDFTNDSPVTHDFCIEDSSGNQVGCTSQISGSTATLTEDLQAGSYTFYCSVDGHRAAGMEGTLTVK